MHRVVASIFVALLLATHSRAEDASAWSREKKRAYAEAIVERLAVASGEARTPPRVRISKRVNVAVFWPDQLVIEMDERTFDLCAKGPVPLDDGLAILLGHELAHFYGNHGWLREFGNDLKPGEFSDRLKKLSDDNRLAAETEADYFGAFTAYLAGFDPVGAAPKLFRAIYAQYAEMPGYPSVDQRVGLAEASDTRLRELIPIFEAGNLMVALRQYEAAATCFDRIAQDFPSREILNNAGVARAMQAVGMLPSDPPPFVYPFELDLDTRLRRPPVVSRGADDPAWLARYARLVREAQSRFEQAIARDPDYATAYVNLAAVYAMQHEFDLARAFADKASLLASRQNLHATEASAEIVLGIAAGDQGMYTEAYSHFDRAAKVADALATANLQVLDTRSGKNPPSTQPTAPPAIQPAAHEIESVGTVSPASPDLFSTAPYQTAQIRSVRAFEPDIQIVQKSAPSWSGYRIDLPKLRWVILRTTTEKTRNELGAANSTEQIRTAYGPPDAVVASRLGALWVYSDRRLIFEMSDKGSVVAWYSYSCLTR